MSKTRKSWQEKLDETHGLPRVELINERLATRWGSGSLSFRHLERLTA
jgi:hypothetical protein